MLKFTKGFFLDCLAISMMLFISITVALMNYGEFPIIEKVKETHLTATALYVLFWVAFICLSHMLRRQRLLLFSRIYSTFVLAFTVWFVFASASIDFIPSGFASIFSVLTLMFNNHYIGIYYFLSPFDGDIYALICALLACLNASLAWGFYLSDGGYFKRLSELRRSRSRSARLREDILALRREKEERKDENDRA